jgi:TfoX/Sxy family transcriptional regulator of competence genes
MAFNEALADRVRAVVATRPGVTEKKMFGGLAFLLGGRMFCGVTQEDLMVRVGAERYDEALATKHARPMDFTGRPLTGYVYVGPGGQRGASLERWIRWGTDCVAALGAKPVKRPTKRAAARARPTRASRTAT